MDSSYHFEFAPPFELPPWRVCVLLFRKSERMIEGLEAQLVKARTDVLDVITRPVPGLLIRPPIFAEKPLRGVLARHKWHSAFSKLKLAESIDQRLERAVGTYDRKVTAHLGRFRLL
jgi:hypothetical protein